MWIQKSLVSLPGFPRSVLDKVIDWGCFYTLHRFVWQLLRPRYLISRIVEFIHESRGTRPINDLLRKLLWYYKLFRVFERYTETKICSEYKAIVFLVFCFYFVCFEIDLSDNILNLYFEDIGIYYIKRKSLKLLLFPFVNIFNIS